MRRFTVSPPLSLDQHPSSPGRHQNAVIDHFVHSSGSCIRCQATQKEVSEVVAVTLQGCGDVVAAAPLNYWLIIIHNQALTQTRSGV